MNKAIPPALRCLLLLLRPYLAEAEIYRRSEDSPWRIRFMVANVWYGLTISRDDALVSAVAGQVEALRMHPVEAETWREQSYGAFMRAKPALLAALADSDSCGLYRNFDLKAGLIGRVIRLLLNERKSSAMSARLMATRSTFR